MFSYETLMYQKFLVKLCLKLLLQNFRFFIKKLVFLKTPYFSNCLQTTSLISSQQVLVGGEECVVESVEDEKIVCRSPSKPASSNETLHMGGRGVLIEELTSESAMYNDTDSPGL